MEIGSRLIVEWKNLQKLFDAIIDQKYTLVGPSLKNEAIVYDTIHSVDELPQGITDEHAGGHYRIKKTSSPEAFGYTVSAQSWKRFLFPPDVRLWKATRKNGKFEIEPESQAPPPRYAFFGVRPCELQAIHIQDKVFINKFYADPNYSLRRDQLLIIVMQCTQAGSNCFCTSMDTGPKARQGFDLAMTEIADTDRHYFVATIGTDRGAALMHSVPHTQATEKELQQATLRENRATAMMTKTLDTAHIQELLDRHFESPRWDETASRCLSCANCTLVCPTCFCSDVEDVTDLTGTTAERRRRWDSCFTASHSHLHGGSVHASGKSRYRQWLMHKLSYWIDQFGESGCVGCGRCMTWCPVGIDLTEEVRAFRERDVTKTS